ncbi:MAG: URC4/urg3 family protein [Pseudolabrys sp.]|nr:URC4/urg3 family protein [Pseudolabrys sp.]MDP2296721.1 URC4/urg3 family protein [Pseudolabrys sp.]
MTSETAAALSLLSAQAVRTRAQRMLQLALDDKLPHFRVDLSRLDATAERVIAITRQAYPSLDIPFHSRWRHFVVDGEDRFGAIASRVVWPDRTARARAEFDLAIVSVFLDAGAGAQWRYSDAVTGNKIGRSEGLALASLDMFAQGVFSADPDDPLRVDASVLAKLSAEQLARSFQVAPDNPLVGLEGRATLLRALGKLVAANTEIFANNDTARPGGLFDRLVTLHGDNLAAPDILLELLHQLGPIWPSRITLGGVPLGDCWKHPALVTADATNGLVPLHKLSQWLSYSLIEPLQRAGVTVTDIDGLTGLAEYRNGGLFVDGGVLALRDPALLDQAHEAGSPLVVEWRALTVALLDRLAAVIREKLGMNAETLPLAKVLEGGTWATGRTMAREKRSDGAPPISVISDGTVF